MEDQYASQVFDQLKMYNLNVDKFINSLRKLSLQKVKSPAKISSTGLTCITYNILRTNSMKNLMEISKILTSKNPDIIALQEVPEIFYKYLSKDTYFTQKYSFTTPTTFNQSYPDGEML